MNIKISLLLLFISSFSFAQELTYELRKDITYTLGKDAYSLEKGKLDFYFPKESKGFTTVIWFHGGGLTQGEKTIPTELMNKKIAVIGAGYRLAPHVKVEDIINDAADVVQWVFKEVEKVGGDKNKIVIAGHSAGAYLALMLALDKSYLQQREIDANDILGIGSFSAQAITHFTARKENGIEELQPIVDRLAPLYWVRKDAPRILLLTGDRDLEMMGRYEENAYLDRMLKLTGHKEVQLYEFEGYGHNMLHPGYPILIQKLEEWSK